MFEKSFDSDAIFCKNFPKGEFFFFNFQIYLVSKFFFNKAFIKLKIGTKYIEPLLSVFFGRFFGILLFSKFANFLKNLFVAHVNWIFYYRLFIFWRGNFLKYFIKIEQIFYSSFFLLYWWKFSPLLAPLVSHSVRYHSWN